MQAPPRRGDARFAFTLRRAKTILAVLPAITLATMTLAVVVGGPPGRAAADPITSCTATTGVIVAVDFSHWMPGAVPVVGCDATLTTGYDALVAAGFTPAGTAQYGAAFVCRIDDKPPPTDDPCENTPPASAFWSYWHWTRCDRSDTWTISQLGATSYRPPAGSVDAWTFGANKPPPFPPSQVAADGAGSTASHTSACAPGAPSTPIQSTSPVPTVTSPVPAPSTAPPGAPGAPVHSAGTGIGAGFGATSPPATAAVPPANVTPTSSATPGGNGSDPGRAVSGHGRRFVLASPASTVREHSSGSPVALVVGVVAAFVLGAAGVAIARRRRLGRE